MAIYEYPTRAEESQQKPTSPTFRATGTQQLEQNRHSGKHLVSPESQCFHISAVSYNHPRPFNCHTVRAAIPHLAPFQHSHRGQSETTHSVSVGQDRTSRLTTPQPPLPPHRVPGKFQRSASDPAVSYEVEKLRPSGDFYMQNGSGSKPHSYRDFAGPQLGWGYLDAQRPSLAEIGKARSHTVNSPARRHRRHSSFYEPPLQSFDEEMKLAEMRAAQHLREPTRREERSKPVIEDAKSLETGSTLFEESTPLEEESASLELESTLLEQESTPLRHAHGYEDPYYPGAEEELSCPTLKQEEASNQLRGQKARKQLWFGNARLSSAAMSNFHQDVTARAYAEDHPKGMTEVVSEEYFYGKYV